LPEKLFDLIDHRVQLYQSPDGKIVKALLPSDIRKAGLFSPRMTAFSGYLKSCCHLSYSTMQAFFSEIFDVTISRGFLSKICTKKLSAALEAAYEEVGGFIRNAPVLGTDETGHNNPAYKSAWTWCQQTPQAVYFHNINSRGSQVLFDILGSDFSGVIECDYFSANKKFVRLSNASVQYCWAHLIRDIKFLQKLGSDTLKQWSLDLLNDIDKILKLWRDRHNQLLEHYKETVEKHKRAFLQKVWHPPNHKQADNIKKRFIDGGESYFLFLEHEGVSPTNNLSEQAIRFVVIDRRITQGTRSDSGMRWCERAWTAVATCARHGMGVFNFYLEAINATYTGGQYPSLIPAKL
jgi:transposase